GRRRPRLPPPPPLRHLDGLRRARAAPHPARAAHRPPAQPHSQPCGRLGTATAYAAMLSAGVTPVVPEHGSLGCSGDLAPLAHCALALMGEGPVRDASGTLMPSAEALAAAGLSPVELAAKEGLALINGTDGMLGMLVMAIADLRRLLRTADVAAAMSV